MVCATGYTITLKSLCTRYSPFLLTAIQAFVGSIFFFQLLFLPSVEIPVHFAPTPALAVFYLGAVISPGAYGLYNYALKKVPASKAVAYVNFIPVFTVILGCLLLGETFNGEQFLAGLLILGGVWGTQSSS